jgi:hypothetical protein
MEEEIQFPSGPPHRCRRDFSVIENQRHISVSCSRSVDPTRTPTCVSGASLVEAHRRKAGAFDSSGQAEARRLVHVTHGESPGLVPVIGRGKSDLLRPSIPRYSAPHRGSGLYFRVPSGPCRIHSTLHCYSSWRLISRCWWFAH